MEKLSIDSKIYLNNHDSYYKLKNNKGRPFTTTSQHNSEFVMRPTTPRSTYLEGCVRENLSPRPLIIRKEVSTVLSLKRQGKRIEFLFCINKANIIN